MLLNIVLRFDHCLVSSIGMFFMTVLYCNTQT